MTNLALSEAKSFIEVFKRQEKQSRIRLEQTVEELQQRISRLEKDRELAKDASLHSALYRKSLELMFEHEAFLLKSQKHEEQNKHGEIIENQLFKDTLVKAWDQQEPNQKKTERLRFSYMDNAFENQTKAFNVLLEDEERVQKHWDTLKK